MTNCARSFPTLWQLFNITPIDMQIQELPLVHADNREALGYLGLQSIQNFFLLPRNAKDSTPVHFFESQLITMLGHITAWGIYFSYVVAKKALQERIRI